MATPATKVSSMDSDGLYDVEDAYLDPTPLTDSWGQFLSMRFRQRREWYEGLTSKEQRLVRKEMKRIEYFREHFKDGKISDKHEDSLVAMLKAARFEWNQLAFQRCQTELSRCENERNCRILKGILRRGGDTLAGDHFTLFTEEDDEKNPISYDPKDRDYGHNGWLMLFKDGKKGAEMDDRQCSGKFPHQKIEIQQLLHNKDVELLRRTESESDMRYFHLPANNMVWVEVRQIPPVSEVYLQPNYFETSKP